METLIKAIRAGKLGIKENKPKESYGVKLVLELLKTGEYNIIAEHLNQQEKNTTQNITYKDIFGDVNAQLKITSIYQTIIRIKKNS